MKKDDFLVLRRIGEGGFAKVHKAMEKGTGRLFALKEIDGSKVADPTYRERIDAEVETHISLDHPHVLRCHGHFEEKGNVFLVLELAEGGELYRHMKKTGPMPEPDAARLFSEVTAGVAYLHGRGIIHRDLKPENILLDGSQRAKIADFGWCADLKAGSRTTFCGTPCMLAPEMVAGGGYDRSVDVWALGVLLFEMLAGFSPFESAEPGDLKGTCERIIKLDFGYGAWTAVPQTAAPLVRGILKKDPKDRLTLHAALSHDWVILHVGPQAAQSIEYAQQNAVRHSMQYETTRPSTSKPLQPVPEDEPVKTAPAPAATLPPAASSAAVASLPPLLPPISTVPPAPAPSDPCGPMDIPATGTPAAALSYSFMKSEAPLPPMTFATLPSQEFSRDAALLEQTMIGAPVLDESVHERAALVPDRKDLMALCTSERDLELSPQFGGTKAAERLSERLPAAVSSERPLELSGEPAMLASPRIVRPSDEFAAHAAPPVARPAEAASPPWVPETAPKRIVSEPAVCAPEAAAPSRGVSEPLLSAPGPDQGASVWLDQHDEQQKILLNDMRHMISTSYSSRSAGSRHSDELLTSASALPPPVVLSSVSRSVPGSGLDGLAAREAQARQDKLSNTAGSDVSRVSSLSRSSCFTLSKKNSFFLPQKFQPELEQLIEVSMSSISGNMR